MFNVVDRKLFGNRVRKGKRVPRFAVYEGGNGIRYHYHLVLVLPDEVSIEQLTGLILHEWRRTHWGYSVIDIKACDQGWPNYMTKFDTKSDFASSIDWNNVVLST